MNASPVIHTDDESGFPMAPERESDRFGAEIVPLGDRLGAGGLGAMLTRVQPGKRAFPFHNHLGNDELFIILAGTGEYRYGDALYPVRSGSVCGAVRGGPDTAHQLINTGSEPLVYVAVSTRNDPDIVEYPDSGKFAAMAIAPGTSFSDAHLKFVGRSENSLDYWDGES